MCKSVTLAVGVKKDSGTPKTANIDILQECILFGGRFTQLTDNGFEERH